MSMYVCYALQSPCEFQGEPGYHDSIDTKWWYPRSFVQGHFCITIKLKNQGSGALRILHPYYKIKVYQNEKKHKFSIESWYPGYSRGGFLSQMGSIESWYPRFNVKTTSYKLLWHWFWVVDLNFIEEKSWHTFSQNEDQKSIL